MGWKRNVTNSIDLAALPALPDRIDFYAQGSEDGHDFECRQMRFDLVREERRVPVRNAKGEIGARIEVFESYSGEGVTLDGKVVTFPARPGWPDAPFTHVKAVAGFAEGEPVVLFEKVAAE